MGKQQVNGDSQMVMATSGWETPSPFIYMVGTFSHATSLKTRYNSSWHQSMMTASFILLHCTNCLEMVSGT